MVAAITHRAAANLTVSRTALNVNDVDLPSRWEWLVALV